MSEGPVDLSDARLEAALAALGRDLRFPPAPDLSGAVRAHLEEHPRRGRSFQQLIVRRAVLLPVLAALALLASVLALSPGARAAVTSWFHVAGVQIKFGTSAPGPLGHKLDLGRSTSLADAQLRLPFHILLPALPDLGKPDAVYLGAPPFQGSVSLVYGPRRGIPRASTTGVGLLIAEFQRHFFDAKLRLPGTNLEQVKIDGDFGLWLTGKPHVVYYEDERGKLLRDTVRLAGDVLVWQHGTESIRLEGRISRQRALEIARSMDSAR